MRILISCFILFVLFPLGNSYSQENIYTWIDKNGVLNITDVPPPSDGEILDVSPSYRQDALEHLRKLKQVKEELARKRLEEKKRQQAVRERKQKAAALEKADALLEKAAEMREDVRGDLSKRRRYESRAQRLEEQAEQIIENPDLIDTMKAEEEQAEKKQSSGY